MSLTLVKTSTIFLTLTEQDQSKSTENFVKYFHNEHVNNIENNLA